MDFSAPITPFMPLADKRFLLSANADDKKRVGFADVCKNVELFSSGRDALLRAIKLALENGKGVILDVQLNDELIFEGMYRELLRNCQIARKEANFDISDRIQINFTATEKLAEVIEKYATEIEKETLSKVVAELTDVDYQKEVSLDEEKVLIKLKK